MAEHDAASPFVAEWRAVDAMLTAGESFANVEAAIERVPLDADLRDALWLAAWAESERAARMDRGATLPAPVRRLSVVGTPPSPNRA